MRILSSAWALLLLGLLGFATADKRDHVSLAARAPAKVSMGWFPYWTTDKFPVSSINWKLYTHMAFAFIESSENPRQFDWINTPVLDELVAAGHKNKVKVLASVGGWGGSRFLSLNVGSAANRTAYVKTLTDIVKKHKLDGIDFDWEFPYEKKLQLGCNYLNPKDTANFLLFLQELRKSAVGSKMIVAATMLNTLFLGPDGKEVKDLSGFAKVLDWIAFMNYDVWNQARSPIVGPHSPLEHTCAAQQSPSGSASMAVQRWSSAGFKKSQIVLGAPLYGHSWRVHKADAYVPGTKKLAMFPMSDAANPSVGDPNGQGWVNPCGVYSPPGDAMPYWLIKDNGFIHPNGTVRNGIDYLWDSCSKTPFVYNPTTEIMVSYDDAKSFAAKGKFVVDKGLRGIAVWEVTNDMSDILMKSIRKAMGL